jgi:hypothetical protein
MLALAGCQALHSDIDVVKDGVLADHNTTTVGKALEGTFQNPKWTSFETPKKEVVVEFNGTAGPKVLEGAGFGPVHVERESCIASLGLKEKIDQEAQASKELAAAFQEERKRFTEKATAALGPGSVDPGDPWEELSASIRVRIVNAPTTRTSFEAMQQEMNSISHSQYEQWDAVKAREAETESKIQSCQQTSPIPVKFQFVLSADKETFKIQYIDAKAFGGTDPNRILAFVYQ